MANPALHSAQYSGSTLYLFWDRAVAVDPLVADDITLLHDGAVLSILSFVVDQNALIFTLDGPVTGELDVSYADTNDYVTAADGGDPALAFTEVVAQELYEVAVAVSALAGEPANNEITVLFSQPVFAIDGDPSQGFIVTVNGQVVSSSAFTGRISADQSSVVLTLPFNLTYLDIVQLDYSSVPGDGLYTIPGGDVDDFEFAEVPNLSTDGLPESAYPLSTVVRQPVKMVASQARGELNLYLNPIDRALTAEFGPAVITTGGTFGDEQLNFTGKQVTLQDGAIMTCSFANGTNTASNVNAAKDWLEVITERISRELGRLRTNSQSVVMGDVVVSGV
jgi:hypothetical protein